MLGVKVIFYKHHFLHAVYCVSYLDHTINFHVAALAVQEREISEEKYSNAYLRFWSRRFSLVEPRKSMN